MQATLQTIFEEAYTTDKKSIKMLEALPEEKSFWKTLKQCLPQQNQKKCSTFVSENGRQRIGFLAPPGHMTNTFLHLIQAVLNQSEAQKIDLIPTTSMAPYGYGKTHGWTKIIRIVPVPLLVGVADTLQHFSLQDQQPSITFGDVKAGLRQQIRYHCRLSHVAAHTALWTVTFEDIRDTPIQEMISQIRQFLDLSDERDEAATLARYKGGDLITLAMEEVTSRAVTLITSVESDNMNVRKALNDVLVDEMRISKNLTAWPCESFWTVGDGEEPLKLSPIVSKVSKAISPNCSAPYTSCFVKRDKCEAKSDGKCP